MEKNTLGLLGTGGGGPSSVDSRTGSMSNVSNEDNPVLSSEVSSSYPDESDLELGLGLSLGSSLKSKQAPTQSPWGQYARILTAQDLPSVITKSSSSSSSSSSPLIKANASVGTKRSADSVSPSSNGVSSQVVGWPPVRAYRLNSLVNQAKLPAAEDFNQTVEKSKSKNGVIDQTSKNTNNAEEKGHTKTSLFVKVNMDGTPIGRKVDMNAHSCYETLAQTLEDMFCGPTKTVIPKRSSIEEHDAMVEATGRPSKLLDGSSEFVLTYEDKDGDWMLVGDVPWGMFISSVKRLRIMRTSEANGPAPRFQDRNMRQRIKPI